MTEVAIEKIERAADITSVVISSVVFVQTVAGLMAGKTSQVI